MDLIDVLERINRSSLRFLQPLTPEATYQTIIEEALKLVNGDEGYIAIAENNKLRIKYAYPPTLRLLRMRKRGFSYTSFSQKKAFVTYMEDFKKIHPELIKAGIQSTIFIPLANKGKSIGVMNIMLRHLIRRFSQKELSILKLFGSLASLAIHKTQLYSETKEALETRNLFLSIAAHEFRTPITTISGYAQLLKTKTKHDELEQKWVEEIYRESFRLNHLIKELLEVNRISLGQLQYDWQENNLAEIIERVAEAFLITHPYYKLNFRNAVAKKNSITICDHGKITQVLNNILDNAAKFSSKVKKIDLSLKKTDKELMIQIKDYGIGISQRDKTRLFEGFYKGSNHTKEGMGLGLYLANQIIKDHRGKITIKSKINQGTIVKISLPRITMKA